MSDNFEGTTLAGKPTTVSRPKNLKRSSSFQKIMHMCNQSCQAFPYLFLWVQEFQTSLSADLRKIIPMIKAFLALRLGVFLSIGLLTAELIYCLAVTVAFSVPSGLIFLLFCIGVLSVLAFQIFNVLYKVKRKVGGTFFVKKKIC